MRAVMNGEPGSARLRSANEPGCLILRVLCEGCAAALSSKQLNHHPLPHQSCGPLQTRQCNVALRIENAIHLRPARLPPKSTPRQNCRFPLCRCDEQNFLTTPFLFLDHKLRRQFVPRRGWISLAHALQNAGNLSGIGARLPQSTPPSAKRRPFLQPPR